MSNFSVSFRAMGSRINIWLSAPTLDDARILEQTPLWFERWEAGMSRFRPASELSFLNAHAGQWLSISQDMSYVIQAALDVAHLTDGLVNPLILPALEAAGYDHTFEAGSFEPGPARLVRPVPDWREIALDPAQCMVWIPAETRLDLGGIAKGWAAQRAAERMASFGACLVDAGGDMVARGAPDSEEPEGWAVALAGPEDEEDGAAGLIMLSDAAIATSGVGYRRWQRDGQLLHHVIDPRTGRPAQTDVCSATVIAPDAVQAEAWGKAALIDGRLPPVPAMLTLRDGSRVHSPEFKTYWRESLCTESR